MGKRQEEEEEENKVEWTRKRRGDEQSERSEENFKNRKDKKRAGLRTYLWQEKRTDEKEVIFVLFLLGSVQTAAASRPPGNAVAAV